MGIKHLLVCTGCGVVLDKNFLKTPDEPLNEYNCSVYECPCCRNEVFDSDSLEEMVHDHG